MKIYNMLFCITKGTIYIEKNMDCYEKVGHIGTT